MVFGPNKVHRCDSRRFCCTIAARNEWVRARQRLVFLESAGVLIVCFSERQAGSLCQHTPRMQAGASRAASRVLSRQVSPVRHALSGKRTRDASSRRSNRFERESTTHTPPSGCRTREHTTHTKQEHAAITRSCIEDTQARSGQQGGLVACGWVGADRIFSLQARTTRTAHT